MTSGRRSGKFSKAKSDGSKRFSSGIAPTGADSVAQAFYARSARGERRSAVRDSPSKMVPVSLQRATMKSIATLRQPSPYLTLLRKLIDEASGMYFAGQEIGRASCRERV